MLNKFKQFKSELGITNSDISEITGLRMESIKNATQQSLIENMRWLKLVIWVWEKLRSER
tara:strand:+ start:820 stop:999 length:180 start_codon:yes stop_codon:yes gene_type:complete